MDIFVNRDQHRLAATDIGPRTARIVVFLHGGGQTRHSWATTAGRLTNAGFRCISLDLRGHGDSFWSEGGDYGLDAHVRDLEDVIADLPDAPILVGASLGGLAALMVAGGTGRVGGLVLVDVTPRIEPQGADEIRQFMAARPDGFASVEEAAEAVADYQPHRTRPTNPAGLMKNLRERDGRLFWHWDPRMIHGRGRPEIGAIHETLREAARKVRCPTLLVRGGRSRVVSLEGVRELQELIPKAAYVNIDKADHMVAGDDNDAFCSPLLDFLRSIIGQGNEVR